MSKEEYFKSLLQSSCNLDYWTSRNIFDIKTEIYQNIDPINCILNDIGIKFNNPNLLQFFPIYKIDAVFIFSSIDIVKHVTKQEVNKYVAIYARIYSLCWAFRDKIKPNHPIPAYVYSKLTKNSWDKIQYACLHNISIIDFDNFIPYKSGYSNIIYQLVTGQYILVKDSYDQQLYINRITKNIGYENAKKFREVYNPSKFYDTFAEIPLVFPNLYFCGFLYFILPRYNLNVPLSIVDAYVTDYTPIIQDLNSLNKEEFKSYLTWLRYINLTSECYKLTLFHMYRVLLPVKEQIQHFTILHKVYLNLPYKLDHSVEEMITARKGLQSYLYSQRSQDNSSEYIKRPTLKDQHRKIGAQISKWFEQGYIPTKEDIEQL